MNTYAHKTAIVDLAASLRTEWETDLDEVGNTDDWMVGPHEVEDDLTYGQELLDEWVDGEVPSDEVADWLDDFASLLQDVMPVWPPAEGWAEALELASRQV